MFEKTMVRGLMAVVLRTTISLAVLLSVSTVARGAIVLTETTPGQGDVTLPACTATIQCWGGGGGGGGNCYPYSEALGGGGGGGAYAVTTYLTLTAGTYQYYIGAGGSGGGNQQSGENGGNSIWNFGGVQDINAGGGVGGASLYAFNWSTPGTNGAGGTVVAGTGYSGGYGAASFPEYGVYDGGGGGGSGGPSGAGGNGSSVFNQEGGSGYANGGNGGYNGNGYPGYAPGGGGGGGNAGANGGNGQIIITYTPLATISLGSVSNATIITGGTGSFGLNILNSAPTGGNNLNYTLGATVQSGSATLGSASGSLAPSTSQACTVSATSTNLGINTVSLTASDPNSSNLSQTSNVTLTVLDHSNASLSSTATQTSQTLYFGNVLKGATIPSQSFTIYNLAANTSAAYTANLKLTTGFTTTGDGAMSTNLSTFNGLQAG